MGKTPKKAAPGGDERNLYVRRLKPTTAASRASESSFLPERQRESENSNRPKLTGIQKRIPTGKNLKSKLRTPAKVGLNQATKQTKLPMKNPEVKTTNMQPESKEAEVKLNVSIQKEDVKEEKSLNINETIEVMEVTAEKVYVESNVSEQPLSETQVSTKIVQEIIPVESEIIFQEKEEVSVENVPNIEAKETEEHEENNVELTLQIEQSPVKDEESKLDDKQPKDDSTEELPAVQEELKKVTNEKEEQQSEAQTDTESYSVDIVESTTSEVSETSESVTITQHDIQKDKEKIDDSVNNDVSFINYDSSIMLKDVQIMLNDCLKDNSKLFDVSDRENTPNQFLKNMSFGRTLRNISGRNSINRMRHINYRERRISPNSSLFVNTSTISVPQDEDTESKILHYDSGLSDSLPTNGSSCDRKRKIESPIWNSVKKQRTEAENNLLNTSINLLKGLRRPIQVSTPNIKSYKFETTKLDISGIKNDDNKITAESTESTKKWCVIM